MEFERKLSLFVAFLVGAVIFATSNTVIGSGSGGGVNLKPLIYHFSIFFFLGIFVFYSVGKNKKLFFLSIFFVLIYAILDEVHQIFISFRAFSWSDIFVNFFGIFVSMIVYLVWLDWWGVKNFFKTKNLKTSSS
jgi:hypothetical protein